MRIIIAGGSGLIGNALVANLSKIGDEVVILSRNPDRIIGLPENAKALQWDGRTIQAWSEEVARSDAVINLTGENISGEGFFPARWTKERKARLVKSRVDSGKVLSEAIRLADNKLSVFIQASGIGFYGTQRDKPLTETDEGGKDFFSDLCRDWEASSKSVESMGVRRIIVRNGVVLSTQGGALPRLLLPYKLFAGGPMGNGRQIYSWIHLEDEVKAIQFLIRNEKASGVFNLTSPNSVTNAEFGRAIGRVLNRPYWLPMPGFLLQLAFGEVASVVLEGQNVLPRKLLENGFVFKFPNLTDALTDLLKK